MSKRNDPVARARGRKAAPVKKPFPWGFVAGSAALAAFLIGILVYAVQNTGEGDRSSLIYAQKHIDGVITTKGLSQKHVEGTVNYPGMATMPPVGGEHNQVPQSCQAYTQPIANEHAVHSLEHGAVWITYNPATVAKGDVDKLTKLLNGDPYRLLSPYPGLKSPISVQAWGEQIFVKKASSKAIGQFLDLLTHGPQTGVTKETNAACQGTTATGPITSQPASAGGTSPAPSAAPSASPK